MLTQFAVWGNSLALRIPRSVAREIHAVAGMSAELSVVKGKMVITPVETNPAYRLSDLLAGITDENRHVEADTGAAQGAESA